MGTPTKRDRALRVEGRFAENSSLSAPDCVVVAVEEEQTLDLEGFVRAHGDDLGRLAFLLTGDRGHAEDLVQTALLSAHKKWSRIAEMEHPLAYVRTIVTREFISWRRRRYTTEVVVDTSHFTAASVADPADALVGRDAVWQMLAGLSRRKRSVLVLKFYLDLSDEQIGHILRCSPATVRSHATRGLKELRRTLNPHTEETLA